jgi:dephospho-CoA kinase
MLFAMGQALTRWDNDSRTRLGESRLTREEVLDRLGRQMPLEQKIQYADYVIDTSGTKENTLAQTRAVYDALIALSPGSSEPMRFRNL